MRGIVKSTHSSTVEDIFKIAKDVNKEEYKYQENFRKVVETAFGKEKEKGILSDRLQYYFKNNPLNWADQLDSIVSLFSPEGELLSGGSSGGLIATSDRSVSIDPKILPQSVLDEFTGTGDRQSVKLRSVRRQFGDKFYINSWEWFWSTIAYALANQPEIEEKRSFTEDESEDQLYFMLTRNPFLVIFRKAMQYKKYRKDSFLMERMRGVFELYFIEDLLCTKKRERKEGKYYLKSHYLAVLFLLIHSHKQKYKRETLQIYNQYFTTATESYSSITNQTNNQNIRYLIRIWMFLMTRDKSLDNQIVGQTENANPRDGWYRLSRCPLEEWVKGIEKVEYLSYEVNMVGNMKKNVYKLLNKQNQWSPSYAFLAVIEQFLEFQKILNKKNIVKRLNEKTAAEEIVTRSFQRILINLIDNGGKCETLEATQKRINEKYSEKMVKIIEINFAVRSEEAKEKLSKTSRERIKTISYQSPRLKNVWEHPLQENEFYIFFQVALWIATQIDKIIPGHKKRKHPCVNIRILSNPFIFFFMLFLVMLMIKWVIE